MSNSLGVIIPVYNSLPYLQELRDSLDHQSEVDLSLIVVNDGSTDGSIDFLESWQADDPRVNIINQANSGLSAARNAGLDYIAKLSDKPEYISFLDSDDRYAQDSLRPLLEKCIADDLDILEFSAESFFESKDLEIKFESYKYCYTKSISYDRVYTGIDYLSQCIDNDDFIPSACLKLYKTQFLLDNNINFLNGILHEDNLFTFTCFLDAKKVSHLPLAAYERRVREDSLMTTERSFRNAYGFFMCGIGSLEELQQHKDIDEDDLSSLKKQIEIFFDCALNDLANCSSDQIKEGIKRFNGRDSVLFDLIINKRLELNEQLEQSKAETAALRHDIDNIMSSRTFKTKMLIDKFKNRICRRNR